MESHAIHACHTSATAREWKLAQTTQKALPTGRPTPIAPRPDRLDRPTTRLGPHTPSDWPQQSTPMSEPTSPCSVAPDPAPAWRQSDLAMERRGRAVTA
ncbi:hypothetical protein N7448_008673 [Penicillium atrosanguineum]|uniref:Uncharacterized protein n=1 Tax=Penicillium atrosanguineum TaxID=1132637 RepID=A0A9W9KZ96_9EURO|nr:uncharacterized protein N7443_000303 [Penicillium atrosanguineum]KAJ5127894.1 hypothetical protein N7448_008673 [Penicillium atrosanguineum]KAJ5148102.1 hypothetical protein N7526_001454 [Penicillium atrosanguineum]KAJ5313419.1 hypothetical protein N7443_000303 [Penicillium atrosanguineum]KAJ5330604.1 hypothetical protein N7476_000387 [Penicillium atrosanguineum]